MAHSVSPPAQPLVLVVDDDQMVRALARGAMELGGFQVAEAESGEEALELFDQLGPNLVLLDLKMPSIDGIETCKRMRRRPRAETTPVIIVTGVDDVESINRAYDVGATDFVTKPVNWEILRHRARYIIRASQAFEARIRSEERSRALLNAIPAIVFQINQAGEVLDYKPVRGVGTFVRPEDFVGRKLVDILPLKVAERCIALGAKAIESGEVQTFEYSVSGSSGESRYDARVVRSGRDTILGIIQDFKNQEERLHYELG